MTRYVLVGLGGMLAGLALAYIFSVPRVETSAPGAVDASTRAVIELRFSRPMQAASVEQRVSVQPEVVGAFHWPDAQTLRFVPVGPFAADTDYGVSLAPGARTARGVVRPWGARFTFRTGHPTLLYLAGQPEADEQINLWRVGPDTTQPRALASLAAGQSVHSFAVSPDGTQIVLSLERTDGGADLALLPRSGGQPQTLLECPGAACVQPTWSPDGTRVAYEQRALVISDIGPSQLTGQVWVLDVASGEAEPVVAREIQQGTEPRWSPDGTRLAFFDASLQAIAVIDFTRDRFSEEHVRLVPNLAGESMAWAPDGNSIVFSEIFLDEEEAALLAEHAEEHDPTVPHEEPSVSITYLHLVQYDFDSGDLRDLSSASEVEDGTPVFSPDGRWLAFGHRPLEGEETTFGRQLWLLDLLSGQQIPLLDEPTYNHAAFSWSPDGTRIAYMRLNRLDPRALADIWVAEVPAGEAWPVAESGFLPAWLP